MSWLLEKNIFQKMVEAHKNGRAPSAQEQDEYEARVGAIIGSDDLPRIMSVVGNSAAIEVLGVLTDRPSYFARYYLGGNTTYGEIRSALARADADPAISEIVLHINSPGGSASAEWLSAMDAVRNTKTPVRAMVGDMAASAAYGIASQADSIQAQNEMSSVGSVGVVYSTWVDEDYVEITSSNAPKKRPDVKTKEGRSVVREVIDKIEEIFISTVARGRDTDAATVKSDFGEGNLVLAEDAVRKNMIDSIATDGGQSAANGAGAKTQTAVGGKTQESPMDLVTLKASHPAVYLAAFDEGKTKGAEDEKDRVNAHLTYGEQCGCMDIASKAIEDGSPVTNALLAKYMTAGLNKKDVETRSQDEIDAAAAADGANTPKPDAEEQAAAEEKVIDEALKLAGMSVEDEEVK